MPETKKIDATTIEPGQYFTAPLYLDERYILLSPETPISAELKERLVKWGFTSVESAGEPTASAPSSGAEGDGQSLTGVSTVNLDEGIQESAIREEVDAMFTRLADFTERLFTSYVSKGDLPYDRITETLKEAIETVRTRRHHVVRIADVHDPARNYIVMHTVKTTVLSLAVGHVFKLPPHRLLELGTAALLHEIGMIRLPSKLYMSESPLSEAERKAITAHPVLGFRILRESSYPMPVCLGVLESHERVDGKGYPRGLTGERISLYAKIIFVCDSYSAQVSKRPFRDARDGHSSLMEMLKERGTAYDEQVLRVLVQLISVYPVGTHVELENGARGVVVDTNDDDPRSPIVRLLTDSSGTSGDKLPTIRTTQSGYRVVRAIASPQQEEASEGADTAPKPGSQSQKS